MTRPQPTGRRRALRPGLVRSLALLALLAMPLCVTAAQAQVVLHELMYHPASGNADDEYIELRNLGFTSAVLDGWSFEGVQYTFPANSTLPAGGYLVLAADALQFEATYGFAPFGEYALALDDGGERLALLDAGLQVADEVVYDDGGVWAVTPDGLGPSLEVIDAQADNATARNWAASLWPEERPGRRTAWPQRASLRGSRR